MSNHKALHDLIRDLAGSTNKITAHRTLCKYMGSLEGGVFLSQLIFWSDKGKDGWFYKKYEEWNEETMLSQYQVSKCSEKCVDKGFLETKVAKANGAPTVHYKLDFTKCLESIMKYLIMENQIIDNPGKSNISFSITEEYQKNTAEGNSAPPEQQHRTLTELPGMPIRRKRQEQQRADTFTLQAKELDVQPPQFRVLVDAVLDVTKQRALAEVEWEDRTLNQAKQTAITLVAIGHRTPESIIAIFKAWRKEWNPEKAAAPSFTQLEKYASIISPITNQQAAPRVVAVPKGFE